MPDTLNAFLGKPAATPPMSFDTPLSAQEEQQFVVWKARYAPQDSGEDYDLRGAFKEGLTPDPKTGHWPDTYKKPNHPTFSVQSKYAQYAPDKAGTWEGKTYIPPSRRAAPKPPDTLAAFLGKSQQPSILSSVAEGFKAAPGNIAAAADTAWNILLMGAQVPVDVGARLSAGDALVHGKIQAGPAEDKRQLIRAVGAETAEQLTAPLTSPFGRMMKAMGYGAVYDRSQVQEGMQTLSEWIKKGTRWVSQKTGLAEDDVSLLFNAVSTAGPEAGIALGKAMKANPAIRVGSAKVPFTDVRVPYPRLQEKEFRGPPKPAEKPAAAAAGDPAAAEPHPVEVAAREVSVPQHDATVEAVQRWRREQYEGQPSFGSRDIRDPNQVSIQEILRARQRGEADPRLLGALAAFSAGALYFAFNPDVKENAGLVLGLGMVGAIKAKGGMWHPEAVIRLAEPLAARMFERGGDEFALNARTGQVADPAAYESAKARHDWATSRVRSYLNKHAGTETDPLKNVEVPFGQGTTRWEELTDTLVKGIPAKELVRPGENAHPLANVPPEETVWTLRGGRDGAEVTRRYNAITALQSYLSHVGEYLRQNVASEKLGQYDLVRAVRETAQNDTRVAKEMEKAAAASTKDLPVYKDYGDGMKWVELRMPEKLTPEQLKRIDFDEETAKWVALDSQGKRIKNSYTEEFATGNSEEEAHLAGQLAQEGNQMGHCVGGYCDAVASGETRIYSLRDAKGQSHVTVEVAPRGFTKEHAALLPAHARERYLEALDLERGGDPEVNVQQAFTENGLPIPPDVRTDILQIKGKQNRAPDAKYLPYVQDFVKGGKWGEVGDLQNTGLMRFGNEWITTEEFKAKQGTTRPPEGQRGSTDPKLLSRLALGGAGATTGAWLGQDQHSLAGAAIGGVAGLVTPRMVPSIGKALFDSVKGALEPGSISDRLARAGTALVPGPISAAFAADKRFQIKSEMDAAEIALRRDELKTFQLKSSVAKEMPGKPQQEAISHWLEGDKGVLLTPTEQKVAMRVREWFAEMGKRALDAGVAKELLNHYVTHVYGREALPFLDELIAQRSAGGTTSVFGKERRGPPTIAETNTWLASKGKPPIASNILEIVSAYGNSMAKALANKGLIDTLKQRTLSKEVGGKEVSVKAVMPARKAPHGYVPFGSAGLAAHPDIWPSLRFAMEADNPIAAIRAIEMVNTGLKRTAVSFSLFHAKNLVDAFAGAAKLGKKNLAAGAVAGATYGALTDHDPITYAQIGAGLAMAYPGLKVAGQAALPRVFGEHPYVKALRTADPAMAKMIDLSIEGGLMYALPKGELPVTEAGNSFYEGLRAAQRYTDSVIPGSGKAIKGIEAVNHAVDGFLWDRLHTGMKLQIFAEKYEALMENNVKAYQANPEKVQLLTETQLAERAASFANDVFGGLNWRRVAEETKTRWGRDLALGAYSPMGRRIMRLGLFAPDWTVATTRAAMKAGGRLVGQEAGSGIKGLWSPRTVTDLHRQYVLRSAFYYAMIGDGLNMALSGHHLWQNADPTYIDTGDGRKMQFSKHTLEPVHWLDRFTQQSLNKLGQIPKEALNQILGVEYLAPHETKTGVVVAGPKRKTGRLAHLAWQFNPIGVQQLSESGASGGVLGALGMPIYGRTNAQRAAERAERQRIAREKRRAKR